MYIVGGILVLFSLIPNFPTMVFLSLGAGIGYFGYILEKRQADEAEALRVLEASKDNNKGDELEDLLSVELVELEVGYGLVNIVDSEQSGDLLERITQLRKQFVTDWGVIIPSVRIKDNLELKAGGYVVKVKGIPVASGNYKIT